MTTSVRAPIAPPPACGREPLTPSEREGGPLRVLLLISVMLVGCGGPPPPEEVSATWTSGDDAPLEGPAEDPASEPAER